MTFSSSQPSKLRLKLPGFTLAELLISLTILGVIAIFIIPKILTAQQNGQSNATAKEAAAMFSAAFKQYATNNTVSSSTTVGVLTQYMNYVSLDTTSSIDTDVVGNSTWSCGAGWLACYKLHNGGILGLPLTTSFGGSTPTNNIWAIFDPDGKPSSLKGVGFYIFYSGRETSWGKAAGIATCNSVSCVTPTGAEDPPWFSW